MDNDSNLKRAAIPLIFEDGTTLYLRPLSDRSSTELDNWIKAKYLHDQRSNIPEGASEELKERIERIAQQTAATLSWYLGLGSSMMVNIEGMAQILYHCARDNHPNITPEAISSILFVGKNLDLAHDAFAKAEGLEEDLKNGRAGRKRNKSQPVKKKSMK